MRRVKMRVMVFVLMCVTSGCIAGPSPHPGTGDESMAAGATEDAGAVPPYQELSDVVDDLSFDQSDESRDVFWGDVGSPDSVPDSWVGPDSTEENVPSS